MNKAPFELLSLEKIIPIDNYLNYSQVKSNFKICFYIKSCVLEIIAMYFYLKVKERETI